MGLEQFFEEEAWGSAIEKEIRNRIKLSVAAYAYEFQDNPFMPDSEFDTLCMQINKNANTGNKICDDYFKKCFDPSTGQWIRKHPELDKIHNLYVMYYKK